MRFSRIAILQQSVDGWPRRHTLLRLAKLYSTKIISKVHAIRTGLTKKNSLVVPPREMRENTARGLTSRNTTFHTVVEDVGDALEHI
jgi:hypothetical protein